MLSLVMLYTDFEFIICTKIKIYLTFVCSNSDGAYISPNSPNSPTSTIPSNRFPSLTESKYYFNFDPLFPLPLSISSGFPG